MLGLPGLGVPELLLVVVLALIIFGPGKLPETARAIRRAINEFKQVSTEMVEPEGRQDEKSGSEERG